MSDSTDGLRISIHNAHVTRGCLALAALAAHSEQMATDRQMSSLLSVISTTWSRAVGLLSVYHQRTVLARSIRMQRWASLDSSVDSWPRSCISCQWLSSTGWGAVLLTSRPLFTTSLSCVAGVIAVRWQNADSVSSASFRPTLPAVTTLSSSELIVQPFSSVSYATNRRAPSWISDIQLRMWKTQVRVLSRDQQQSLVAAANTSPVDQTSPVSPQQYVSERKQFLKMCRHNGTLMVNCYMLQCSASADVKILC